MKQKADDHIDTMTRVANLLGLEHADTSSFLCAVSALDVEEQRLRQQLFKANTMRDQKLALVEHELGRDMHLLSRAIQRHRDQQYEEQARISEFKRNIAILEAKEESYSLAIEEYQKAFVDARIDQITVDDLAQLDSETRLLEEQVAGVESRLKAFQSLPPDLVAAGKLTSQKMQEFDNLVAKKREILARMVR
ncbi:MAG: hypothetical protein SGCHY_003897 [Lobulomycetales sp.]